jgi:hypothetical protein
MMKPLTCLAKSDVPGAWEQFHAQARVRVHARVRAHMCARTRENYSRNRSINLNNCCESRSSIREQSEKRNTPVGVNCSLVEQVRLRATLGQVGTTLPASHVPLRAGPPGLNVVGNSHNVAVDLDWYRAAIPVQRCVNFAQRCPTAADVGKTSANVLGPSPSPTQCGAAARAKPLAERSSKSVNAVNGGRDVG